MPHALLKLLPGVNTTQTPALNESGGVSQSQLIRWFFDPIFGALVQKLGGWLKFFPNPMPAIVRALWAWEDLDDNARLAVGTMFIPGQSYSQLSVITNGTQQVITPTQASTSLTPPAASSTSGSPSITISDFITTGITNVNSVYIPTQIAIGGVVLFGLYACDPDGYVALGSYTVYARDILGNLLPATSSSAAPVLPTFTTTAGSDIVEVDLPANTMAVGLTFPVLTPTAYVGGTLFGNYVVQSVVDANHFTIQVAAVATASGTVTLNNGAAVFIYNGYALTPPSAVPIGTSDWTMDNFGEDLVVCPSTPVQEVVAGGVNYQPIYLWDPHQLTATVIPEAPPVNDGVFVSMPSRQIVACGSTATGVQDPLLINWSDVNNPNQWIALATNQAGSNRISKGSRIVSYSQGPQQALIWTDIDVWSMVYVGLPYVFSFNEIGTGCGSIARKAVCSLNGIYYWMGPSQFYSLSSAGVLPVPCPVWDFIFQNLDQNNLTKIRSAVNSRFGEAKWFFPSLAGGGEVDSYVKFNVYIGVWDYGTLGRTAWVDQSVLGPPIGADPTSLYLYQHETSNDADGTAMVTFFRTGYYTISEGDFQTFVDLVWPDAKWGTWAGAQTATLQITFYVVNYPGDTPRVFGPYPVTKATRFFNTRLRGRLVSVQIGSNDLGSFWRIGALRYRFAPDGKFG